MVKLVFKEQVILEIMNSIIAPILHDPYVEHAEWSNI